MNTNLRLTIEGEYLVSEIGSIEAKIMGGIETAQRIEYCVNDYENILDAVRVYKDEKNRADSLYRMEVKEHSETRRELSELKLNNVTFWIVDAKKPEERLANCRAALKQIREQIKHYNRSGGHDGSTYASGLEYAENLLEKAIEE
jgi:hypothetical protein